MKNKKYLKVYSRNGAVQAPNSKHPDNQWVLHEWCEQYDSWVKPGTFIGYNVSTVEGLGEHSLLSFVFGNSIKKIDEEIQKRMFVARYGPAKKEGADINCPHCGYAFYTPDPIVDNDYNSFQDEAFGKIDCICGKSFAYNVEFEIVVSKVNIRAL